jgi:S1-C subfamily serine protease
MKKETIYNLILLLSIGVVGGLLSSYAYLTFNSKSFSPVSINKIEEKTYIQENDALEQGIKGIEKSLIAIKNSKGVFNGIILTNDGLIATLSSNIQGDDQIITSSGESLGYNIVKRDYDSNIAIIKVKKDQLTSTAFFDFEELDIGKRVYSLSLISDNAGKLYYSVNEAIIKSLGSGIKTNLAEKEDISGSPIFDIENRLIGIAYIDDKGNIGVIPSSKIRSLAGLD